MEEWKKERMKEWKKERMKEWKSGRLEFVETKSRNWCRSFFGEFFMAMRTLNNTLAAAAAAATAAAADV